MRSLLGGEVAVLSCCTTAALVLTVTADEPGGGDAHKDLPEPVRTLHRCSDLGDLI